MSKKTKSAKKEIKKNLNDIVPTQIMTNARFTGHKIVELSYPKGDYSRSDMEKLIAIQQAKYKDTPLTMMPSIHLARDYRSMKAFSVDAKNVKIDLYGAESDHADHFCIYIWKNKGKAGGKDEHNDCLFTALCTIVNKEEIKTSWCKAYKFKKRLGLERDDLVSIDSMPTVEKALNININVSGDHTFVSAHTHPKTVNLKLINGHYSIENKKSNDLVKTLSFKDQRIVMSYELKECVYVYDGENMKEMTYDDYYVIKNNIFGPVAVIKAMNSDKQEIVKEYDTYVENMKHIKKESGGLVNYWNCGGNHKNAVLRLFYNKSKGIEDPEAITALEEEYIKDCFAGPLIFGCKNVTLEEAYVYDLNSAYPSILTKTYFKIPVKQGNFKRLDSLPEILTFGIYRVKITKCGDKNKDKLFRFNFNNKYTHYDIYTARKLGLKIELVVDDQANCLLYGAGKCITSCTMFKTLIEYLYPMKQKGVVFAKKMLNSLWGALSQKNVVTKVNYTDGKEYNIPDDCFIVSMKPTHKGHLIQYSKTGRHFKLNYARMAPFMTAVIRKQMADTIYEHREYVYRCHTDSILSTKPLSELKISTELGEWKIEKNNVKCIIKNCMEVKYFDN